MMRLQSDFVYLTVVQTFSGFILTLVNQILAAIQGYIANYNMHWCKWRGYVYYDVTAIASQAEATQPNVFVDCITAYLSAQKFPGNMTVTPSAASAPLATPVNWTYSAADKVWFKYTVTFEKSQTTVGANSYTQKTRRYELCGIGNKTIDDFIAKCVAEWNAAQKVAVIEKKLNILQGFQSDQPMWMTYDFVSAVTFDGLFFPQKDLIIKMIAKLAAGKIRRFNILLSGEPGCGKTSVIKAICNYTRRVMYDLKLTKVTNANQLNGLFFNTHPFNHVQVPNSRRMFLIEEIDQAGAMVEKREIVADAAKAAIAAGQPPAAAAIAARNDISVARPGETSTKKPKIKKGLMFANRDAATLGDLLTTFDGVLELSDTITIITTNHPEKLDPALIREGRIQLHCVLKPCLISDAVAIIRKVHPEYPAASYPLGDYSITPARLEAFSEMSDSADELNARLVGTWEQ